ncbi:MAG: universal stress protein [Bacteroidetes bacterium]|nr:universal stress protein [Bacteroidota bacterium]
MDHFLTGSDTFSVIDSSTRPVLLVPRRSDFSSLRKVVFATNFSEQDINAIRYLIKLGDIFNFRLEVFHVNRPGQDDITKRLREIELEKHTHKLKYSAIEVKEVYGKDIIDRLDNVCRDVKADLLSFSHYHDSLISGLFKQSLTKKALAKQKLPLLIFPSKFVA